ncbi:MAG: succinate--CoA ligase subunit alpha, partial [Candidatus Contubernalis sp.]|nr:succinate--CoA ligase subunit alpha [Candidatus Contubernalis sp.]
MAILISQDTKIVVQGITGREGRYHSGLMLKYGTNIVAGCSPGKGGQKVSGVPVFNTVKEAATGEGADTSIIFVPPGLAIDSIYEAAEA